MKHKTHDESEPARATPKLRLVTDELHPLVTADDTGAGTNALPSEQSVKARSAEEAGRLEYELVSSLPGRFRLKVQGMRGDPAFERLLCGIAAEIAGVTAVRSNRLAASLVVHYDVNATTESLILQSIRESATEALRTGTLNTGLAADSSVAAGSATAAEAAGFDPVRSVIVFVERAINWLQRSMPPLAQLAVSAAALGAALLELPVAPALSLLAGVPILTRATQTAVHEKRIGVDGLDGMAAVLMMAHAQFKPASFMMTLISLGEYIRELTAARCQKIVSDLLGMQGASAWLVRGKRRTCIPADQVRPGDMLVVYPGDIIPVDGTVSSGEALVNQASLTGESAPVEVRQGSKVFASTVVVQGQIYTTCTNTLEHSRAQTVLDLVSTAPISETKIENYAAKMADKAVMPIIGSAFVSLALTGNATRMMSMLIYDFSTGIRIAAPTAVLASMGHAGRLGILIKSGGALERLSKVNAIIFDKTGTLTSGHPRVTDIHVFDSHNAEELVAMAAAVESRLNHPAAQAIVDYAQRRKVEIPHRSSASHSVSMGVSAIVDGKRVLVGSRRLMESNNIDVRAGGEFERHATARGESYVYVAVEGQVAGLISYADSIRPEAAQTIKKLHKRGVKRVIMATGDIESTARRIAAQVGLDEVVSGAFPENKANLVRQLKEQGYTVAVVGDGINDSPALAHADVAISLHGATPAAREYADVVLTDDNLLQVAEAIDIARGAMGLINQTMALVAIPNAAGLALTACGLVGPAGATLLNNGSAIVAAINSLRPLLAPGWSKQ